MITPEQYIGMMRHKSYTDLIRERNNLVKQMYSFEKKERAGDRSGVEWILFPQPDVQYQMTYEYLAALCRLIRSRYNEDYASAGRTLQQDV